MNPAFGQDNGNQQNKDQNPTYWIMFDQGDHLRDLLSAKNVAEAADLYKTHYSNFFSSREEKLKPILDQLAQAIIELNAVRLEQARQDLDALPVSSDPNTWAKASTAIQDAKKLLDGLDQYSPLLKNRSGTEGISVLASSLQSAKDKWEQAAPEAFSQFDIGSNFFRVYPYSTTDKNDFLTKNLNRIAERLSSGGKRSLVAFINAYPDEIKLGTDIHSQLGVIYFSSHSISSNDPDRLKKLSTLIRSAKEDGFQIQKIPNIKIGFAEVTSQTLLKEGQIEFPVSIEVDLPFETQKTTVEEALSAPKGSYDYVIVIDVNLAQIKQGVQRREEIPSQYLSGSRAVPNQAYEQARMAVYEAQSAVSQNASQYCSGYGCIAKGIAGIAFAAALNEKKKAFAATPMTVTESVYEDYKYSISDMDTSKLVTANYYVFDMLQGKYNKSVFDVSERKSFKLAYNVHEKDRDRNSTLSRYDSEETAKKFEKESVTVRLSDVLNQYVSKSSEGIKIPSIAVLREDMLKDKNTALAVHRTKVEQRSASTKDDARFESVVVILNPKGSLGSGIYVTPDLILTNYHVIEGAQFVEMKLRNGLETFGKVVKSDVRLDLALVKVQARGKPVQFYSGPIQLGSTVEAIGHPRGLDFTITRGVVSAIRNRPSPFGVGGKEVVFVQTDTPINSGNSGGPLYLGDKVIAVNDNKIVAKGTEGIAFSIHYSEVEEFLKEVK